MARRARKNASAFQWTGPRTLAARLVAEDEISDREIAAKVGVHIGTLERWKLAKAFKARVEEIAKTLGDRCLKYAIARKGRRMAALQDRWERMQRVIAERAAAPEMEGVPGGETGALVHTQKSIGGGPAAQVVDEYAFDAALFKELREHEKQAAEELGQLIKKHEHTGAGGKDLIPAPKQMSREQFAALSDEERLLYLRGQLVIEVVGGEGEKA